MIINTIFITKRYIYIYILYTIAINITTLLLIINKY